jgi:hypothetical protein
MLNGCDERNPLTNTHTHAIKQEYCPCVLTCLPVAVCFPVTSSTLPPKPPSPQVRCRSPWSGIAALIKSIEEAPDVETPTAAAAAAAGGGGPHRMSSGFGSAEGAAGGPPPMPPPPPPPRTSSSQLPAQSFDAELKLMFFGDPAWGVEPVRARWLFGGGGGASCRAAGVAGMALGAG